MRNEENICQRMNGRNTSDVHTCVAKWSISLDGTFCSEVNHKIVVKLNTGCVQNVVTTWRGGLGRPRLVTDAEDSFFPGIGDTYPHLDEIHGTEYNFSVIFCALLLINYPGNLTTN
jgi:hypothetical protein